MASRPELPLLLAQPLDYFGSRAQIDALDEALPRLPPSQRVEALVRLAWYLRQRDSARAIRLAGQALAALDASPEAQARSARARLLLMRAEITALMGDVEAAALECRQALEGFQALGDAVGKGDAQLIEARLTQDLSSAQDTQVHIRQALACFQEARDEARAAYAEMFVVEYEVMRGNELPVDDPRLVAAEALHDPGVDSMRYFALGTLHDLGGDLGRASALYRMSYEAGIESGRVRTALSAGSNAGSIYAEMGSPEAALKWTAQSLELARVHGWPVPLAQAIAHYASLLRGHGRREEAKTLVAEAERAMAGLPRSRTRANLLCEQGSLEDDPQKALAHFTQGEAISVDMGISHVVRMCQRGRARALSELGRGEEALAVLEGIFRTHRQNPAERMEAWRTQAHVARRLDLAAPEGSGDASGVIHALKQACSTMRAEGLPVPADLLQELSRAHEAAGDLDAALACEREAATERERAGVESAARLVTELQTRHEVERSKTQAAHYRALAQASAERAAAEARAREAKSSFLAGMSHELRSPLIAILGFTDLLLRAPDLAALRDTLQIIRRNGGELQSLIEKVLDDARIEAGQRTRHREAGLPAD